MRAKLTVFGSCVLKASVGRHVGRHSTDISIDTRPISRSTLGRYVDRHPADIGRLSTDMHVGRYSIAKPSTLGRHSADALPTRGRYSTDSRWILYRHLIGSQRPVFLYSNCSRFRCPLHLVLALSVAFVGTIHLWLFYQLMFFLRHRFYCKRYG